MIEVLLFILKVLGIILLCVIGLLLLVACIVLFVPVRYKYRFRYDDNNKSINCNYIDLHWIMYIIRCRILISLSSIKYETRLFGIRTKWLDRLIFKTDLNDESIDEDSNDAKELLDDIEEIWEDLSEEYSESNSDNVKQETDKVRTSTKKSSWKVLNPINWCKIILDKIVSIVKFICRVIKSSIKSIELLVKRIDLVLDFLDKNSTIKGIERVKKYISMVCRHVLPRKKKIDLTIGFDDPAHTGSVLALLGTFYPLIGKGVRVYPNYYERELKVNCKIVGKVRGINVVYIAVRVMKDKIIKRLLYNFNHLKEEL